MDTKKNILFISYDGMTDPLGQSQVIPYLRGISKHGYKIFLLSCEKGPAAEQNTPIVKKMLEGYDIKWIPIPYTKKPPILSTIKDVIKLKKTAKKIHQEHHIDMVHTRSGVPALVGLWMKKKFGVKFLNDIREFYADGRVDGNMWNLKNPLYKIVYRYFKKNEARQIKASDGIVCLTYAAEKIIHKWPEYNIEVPMQVIPCCADLDLFDPSTISEDRKEQLKQELGVGKNNFVLSYLGSIGGWYLTAEMLEFCKILSDKSSEAVFLFISPHRHDEIMAAANRFGIPPEKIITRKAGRKEVPTLLSLSDFSIFFIKPCYSKQSSSPTKHGEIMAMGIPLITNSGVGDVEDIVVKYRSGIIIDRFDPAIYSAVATEMLNNKTYDKQGIRQAAKAFYSLDGAIEKYRHIYDAILQ